MAITLEKLQKLVSLDPNDPLSRFALGKKLYETSQNLPEAADHLRFAHRAAPTHLATYNILSRVLIALGHRDEARTVLTEGIRRVSAVGEGMGRDLGPLMQQLLAQLDTETQLQATIRLASPEEIIDLRWTVLRAGMNRADAIFPGDDAPETLHAIAIVNGATACCATLMTTPPPEPIIAGSHPPHPWYRLRGMATSEQHRGLRLGRQVLTFLESQAASRHTLPPHFWCNARIGAVRFYQSQGWKVATRQPYDIPTAGLHHTMEKTGQR